MHILNPSTIIDNRCKDYFTSNECRLIPDTINGTQRFTIFSNKSHLFTSQLLKRVQQNYQNYQSLPSLSSSRHIPHLLHLVLLFNHLHSRYTPALINADFQTKKEGKTDEKTETHFRNIITRANQEKRNSSKINCVTLRWILMFETDGPRAIGTEALAER